MQRFNGGTNQGACWLVFDKSERFDIIGGCCGFIYSITFQKWAVQTIGSKNKQGRSTFIAIID